MRPRGHSFPPISLAVCLATLLLACSGGSQVRSGTAADTAGDDGDDGGDNGDKAQAQTCKTPSDCGQGQYCSFPTKNNKCGGTGTCAATEFACPEICEPVCGCDGNTYDNYCRAHMAGTSPAFSGFCLESPSTGCWGASAGTACSYATAQSDCNANAPSGTENIAPSNGATSNMFCDDTQHCSTIPSGCADDSNKAVGMDNVTYKNDCDAYWSGRVTVLCHPDSGPVCDVDQDITYPNECAFLQSDAGVTGYSQGACN